jgi:DNA-directed RNA polymerase alpha subunit
MEDAARILVVHYQQVYQPMVVEAPKEVTLEDRIEDEVLRLTVEELDLPTRIANALRKGGYKTVKDLTEADSGEVAKVKNLGENLSIRSPMRWPKKVSRLKIRLGN